VVLAGIGRVTRRPIGADWPASGHWLRSPYRGMNVQLNALQAEVLIRELSQIIQNDRYPLSPRIRVLTEILGMLRPEPPRPEPLPPQRHYEPPRGGRYRRR
jgi:hypothetical protein